MLLSSLPLISCSIVMLHSTVTDGGISLHWRSCQQKPSSTSLCSFNQCKVTVTWFLWDALKLSMYYNTWNLCHSTIDPCNHIRPTHFINIITSTCGNPGKCPHHSCGTILPWNQCCAEHCCLLLTKRIHSGVIWVVTIWMRKHVIGVMDHTLLL